MRIGRPDRGLVLALFGIVGFLFSAGCGGLSRDELNRGVESLSALAAQGELIANGVAGDAEPSPEVRKERNAAVQIAGELADLFLELQTFPGNEHHGVSVGKRMAEVKEQADAVVERLTGEET